MSCSQKLLIKQFYLCNSFATLAFSPHFNQQSHNRIDLSEVSPVLVEAVYMFLYFNINT